MGKNSDFRHFIGDALPLPTQRAYVHESMSLSEQEFSMSTILDRESVIKLLSSSCTSWTALGKYALQSRNYYGAEGGLKELCDININVRVFFEMNAIL